MGHEPKVGKNRILIVDDDAIIVEFVAARLREMDVDDDDVVAANGGRAALDQILDAANQFTLIIADWNMADISGIDLLKTVRSKGSDIPFIMLTANLTPQHLELAKRHGVDDYIVKPLAAEAFRERVKGYLS